MPATTVSIVCDVSLPNALEFTSATFRFQLSEPDYDTADNETIATTEITAAANASGVATVSLWPVTRGTRNSFYRVSLSASVMIGGVPKWQDYSLGVIRPPATGAPHDLADLLAQSSGGIIVGSTVYATLADAVAAAVAAAADAEATVADAVADLNAAGAVILADVTAAGNAAVASATTQANRADTEADRAQTEANRADTQADRAEAAAAGYESLGNAIALAEAEVARAALEADRAEAAADGVAASEAAAADSAAAAAISAGIAVAAVESTTSEGATWRPEYYGATGVGNDTAALAAWLASGGPLHVIKGKVYQFNAALTFPAGVKISGHLNLVWIGVGSVPIATINDDVAIDDLTISCPTTTGNTVTIGRNYKGRSIVVNGFGNSGAGAVTISDPEGLDLDLFESTGGFQRPLTLGNGLVWSVGGRIGMVRVRDYTRGIGMNYLDGFQLEGYDIQGRNALASFTAGHNGIIAAGLRNCRFGPGIIANAGEHLFRLGGVAEMGASYNNTFGDMTLEAPGGCYIKLNANAIAYDFRFGDINAVGRFASVPGGNREFLRLSHCRDLTFGVCRLVVGDGFAYSAQDALALNDIDGVYVQALHVEGLGQSVVDYASGQDIGEGLGNGDVRNISIGALTGTDLTNRTMVRFAMATGFEAGSLTISSIDYFSDGPLFSANGTTVVDAPCTIGPGRIRKTDLTTLPSTTNLPAIMALDLEIGQRRVKNLGGALAFADLPTPWDFGALGLADDTVALQAWAAAIQGRTGYLPPDSHFRTTQEILLNSNGTSIIGTGTIEQLTWGLSGIQIWGDDCTIDGPRIISTQTKTLISTALSQRYRGDGSSARCSAVYVVGDNFTCRNSKQEGFVGGIKLSGRRVWRPNVTLTSATTTTMVLNAADLQADDYYNGMVIRVLGTGVDSSEVTIVDYVAATNTITVETAWTVAPNGSGRYYVIHMAPLRGADLVNNNQNLIDFGVTMTWAESIWINGLYYINGGLSQDPAAPPHAIYVTGDSAALRTTVLSTVNVFVDGCWGSGIKYRGVDGLTIADVHVANARGIASIEQCINVTGGDFVGHDLGVQSNGRPSGVNVTGCLNVHLGDISAHFSPIYEPGLAAVDYSPTGLLIQSDLDGSGDYSIPENVTAGQVSAHWETSDSNGLILYAVNTSRIADGTVNPATKRVKVAGASAVASGAVTAIRFASSENSEVLSAYAKSITGGTARAAVFDSNATNCRVYYDALENAAMTVSNSGTGCFTHQPGELAAALAGAITPLAVSPQGQLTGTGNGGSIAVQGNAATWSLRGDAFQSLTMARLRASGTGTATLWYGWSSGDSALSWMAINPDATPRIRSGNGLLIEDATGVDLLNIKANGAVVGMAVAVASLPAAASNTYGRMFVTDSTVAASGNFGAIVAGGGANRVPVWSDGTNWRIG